MYAAFSLEINDPLQYSLLETGNKIYKKNEHNVKNEIEKYIQSDGTINATKMQSEWFPEVTADIFISHSSKDQQLAIQLAGWLKENFDLECFIDSCVWGFCDNLLKKIDDRYCYIYNTKAYDYTKRNYSTSHVHNMLAIALNKMIDKSECIFFLNTKNSIKKSQDDLFKITESPWIYNELSTIETIRKKIPDYLLKHYKIEKRAVFDNIAEYASFFPSFEYEVNFNNLITINWKQLQEWKEQNKNKKYPLLYLYEKFKRCDKKNE